jgi:hypothetical protein
VSVVIKLLSLIMQCKVIHITHLNKLKMPKKMNRQIRNKELLLHKAAHSQSNRYTMQEVSNRVHKLGARINIEINTLQVLLKALL